MGHGAASATTRQSAPLGGADERTVMKKQMISVNPLGTPVLALPEDLALVDGGAEGDWRDIDKDGVVTHDEGLKTNSSKGSEKLSPAKNKS
jgi:hypothetical protein